MKFSERWLREWIDPPVDTAGLVEQLTGAGLEVDSTQPAAEALDKVVVGRVIEAAAHPQADQLTLCRVDVGADAPLEIVCGAPDARAGLKAPVALPGARLAGGQKIRKSKIRGQLSAGMLCSARELGLGDDAEGLLELEADAPVGDPFQRYAALDDTCIDVDLTPNRGDCLCVEGIARDVAAVNGKRLEPLAVASVAPECDASVTVELESPEACPRYVGRVIRDIDPRAKTPLWMVERLRRSGVRALSPVVDVTNYVMLELGHPMHAFDLDRLRGGIRVRHAQAGEHLRLLDESGRTLGARDLLITDHEGPVALAGVMGGLDSAVTEATSAVFLECAWFEPRGIGATARRLGLSTDASHRFERHVNPQGQMRAVERATALLLDIVGGRPGPLVDTVEPRHLPTTPCVTLRSQRIRRLLGVEVPGEDVRRVLECLHMQVEAGAGEWRVTPPAYRPDIGMEADLIEEVARIRGYHTVPEHAPVEALAMSPRPEGRRDVRELRRTLVQRGYQEAVTYSFVDAALQERMEQEVTPIPLCNPISSDMGVMRTSMMPGLLQAAIYNSNRQLSRVRLFETGLVYRQQAAETQQTPMLGGVALGPVEPPQWGVPGRSADFHDVKADVESLFGVRATALEWEPAQLPALHPGQCARVRLDGRLAGTLGLLHPTIARDLKLSTPAVLFELELAVLRDVPVPAFKAFSRQPVVRRDLAVVVDEPITAQELRDCVGQAGIDMLQNLELFDVYRGEGVDSGRKSLALTLTFQAASRTLDDAEVDACVKEILHALAKHLGGTLRG